MNYKHGETVNNRITRLYRIWGLMKNRCNNPNNPAYKDYGGRGITVCQEWHDFVQFKQWALSHGYQDDLTIDRIDFNGNYCPENCRWITMAAQQGNTRANTFYTINGETHHINEWARIYGLKPPTIIQRINHGWSVEEAITTPVKRNTNHDFYERKHALDNYSKTN